MAAVLTFMEGPLVTWIKTFQEGGDGVDYQDLCDGAYLNDVMCNIDQRDLDVAEVNRAVRDNNARLQNWALLLRSLNSYYQDILQQLIVMEQPDIVAIVKDPTKESSVGELSKVLLLLLGCAVQCDRKQSYIQCITQLEVNVQEAIVEYIKQVTNQQECVYSLDTGLSEDTPETGLSLRNVVQQRNSQSQRLVQLVQERDYWRSELEGRGAVLTPPVHLEKYHLQKQVSNHRSRLNSVTEDLEEKTKQVSDCREELEQCKAKASKLQQENLTLRKDAKSARNYRDELDELKEKAMKVSHCEKEILKYKEKLNEMEFYKSRVEELRDDNSSLAEAKISLEEQSGAAQRKVEGMTEELLRTQLQLEQANSEREQCSKQMQDLVEEVAALEQERREGYENSARLPRILSYSSVDLRASQLQLNTAPVPGSSICDEMNDTMASRVTRLESERDQLGHQLSESRQQLSEAQTQIDRIRHQLEREYQAKVTEVERQGKEQRRRTSSELSREFKHKVGEVERQSVQLKHKVQDEYIPRIRTLEEQNQQLNKRVCEVEDTQDKERQNNDRLRHINRELETEREHFQKTIRQLQESSSMKIRELEEEVTSLQAGTNNLQRRNRRISDLCDSELNTSTESTPGMAVHRERKSRHKENGLSSSNTGRTRRIADMCDSEMNTSTESAQGVAINMERKPRHKESSSSSSCTVTGRNSPISLSNSSTSTSCHDILRKKTSSRREGRDVGTPIRPHTVVGVAHEQPPTPVLSVGSPQRHSSPLVPDKHHMHKHTNNQLPFKRHDKHRSSNTSMQSYNGHHDPSPFVRGDPMRASMPERNHMYATPEQRLNPASRSQPHSASTRLVYVTPDDKLDHRDSGHSSSTQSVDRKGRHGAYKQKHSVQVQTDLNRNSLSLDSSTRTGYNSDKDSGCATSPESPTTCNASTTTAKNGDTNNNTTPHKMTTSLHVVTTEQMVSRNRTSVSTTTSDRIRANEKCKSLVEKVVELQNRNQELQKDNSDQRKTISSLRFSMDRLDHMEKKNLKLDLDNKKLRKIVETLQYSLTGKKIPYDLREYQFSTNV